jgi:hypothetical protein
MMSACEQSERWYTKNFRKYSQRIQQISIDCGYDGYQVDDTVYKAWCHLPGGFSALFPNLRTLNCSRRDAWLVAQIKLLFPLMLRELRIDLARNNDVQIEILSQLQKYCSQLQSLALYDPERSWNDESPLCNTAIQVIVNANRLRVLRIDHSLSANMMHLIAQLPNLQVVWLSEAVIKDGGPYPQSAFPALQLLHVGFNPIHLINVVSSQKLEAIYCMRSHSGRSDISADNAISLLAACVRHHVLKSLSLYTRIDLLTTAQMEIIITTLAGIPALKSLSLTGLIFSLADDALALRLLHLFSSERLNYLNVLGLAPVSWPIFRLSLASRNQRRDIFLGLIFDSSPPLRQDLHELPILNNNSSLDVAGDPGAGNVQQAWRDVICHLFPNLQSLVIHHEEQDDICRDRIRDLATSVGVACIIH